MFCSSTQELSMNKIDPSKKDPQMSDGELSEQELNHVSGGGIYMKFPDTTVTEEPKTKWIELR
jgi:bacteriocin-like protein